MKKLLFLIISISPLLVKAQAFSTGYVSEKQNAMAGAGAGTSIDAASGTLNPASIAFLDGNSVSVGAGAAVSNTAYLDANNNSLSRTKNSIGTPFHVHFVYGVKDSSSALSKFKFGVGVTTPYGGDVHWENDWTGKYSIVQKKLSSIVVAPTVSYKINNKFSLGAVFIASQSFLHVENAVPVSQDANVIMDFKLRGFGYAAGVFYKPTDKLSFGLAYLSEVKNKSYEGTATFNVPASLTSQFPTGDATTKSSVPSGISFGTGYKLNDKLLLAFDFTYGVWSVFDSTVFIFKAATSTSAVSSERLPNKFTNTIALRLGAQYKINDTYTALAGVNYEQTPVPSDYVYPDTPDADRIGLTAGMSYNINKTFSVDVSYRFVYVMKRTTTNEHSKMNGTYQTFAHVPGLTLIYNF